MDSLCGLMTIIKIAAYVLACATLINNVWLAILASVFGIGYEIVHMMIYYLSLKEEVHKRSKRYKQKKRELAKNETYQVIFGKQEKCNEN